VTDRLLQADDLDPNNAPPPDAAEREPAELTETEG
jgi:hypothetical protein